MNRLAASFLLMAAVAWAGDFQQAKIIDVQTTQKSTALSRWANSDGASLVIPPTSSFLQISVVIGDMGYVAEYHAQKHLNSGTLVVGDSIAAQIEGDKLVLKGSDGKNVKGKIVRRERLTHPANP